jgi:hypothetical protein
MLLQLWVETDNVAKHSLIQETPFLNKEWQGPQISNVKKHYLA